jgi:hypothetical protein
MDKQQLLKVVSSLFETESHKQDTDKLGNRSFNIAVWHKVNDALSLLDFPEDPLLLNYTSLTYSKPTPLVEVKPGLLEHWIKFVHEFTFVNLYPHVMIALSVENQITYSTDIWKLKFIVENYALMREYLSPAGKHFMKAWVNYYYGVKNGVDKVFGEQVTSASRSLLEKLKRKLGNRYIAADTDTVYYAKLPLTEEAPFLEETKLWGFPYTDEEHIGGIFFGKKKHLLFTREQGISLDGFPVATF